MLCVLLVIILSITGVRTLQKAIHARRKERWLCCTRPQEATTLLGGSSNTASGIQIIQTTSVKTVPTDEQPRAAIPWPKIGALFGLFFGILLLNILHGTSKFPSPLGVSPSSTLSPLLSALPFAFLGVISYLSWKNVTKAYAKQQEPDYEMSPHEIKWTSQSLWYFPFFSVSAGTVSGMFGIGGGIINGPLLLELGVDPAAASAITATTVLFSSGSTFLLCCALFSLSDAYNVLGVDWTNSVGVSVRVGRLGRAVLRGHPVPDGLRHDVRRPRVPHEGHPAVQLPVHDRLLHGHRRARQRRRHERRERALAARVRHRGGTLNRTCCMSCLGAPLVFYLSLDTPAASLSSSMQRGNLKLHIARHSWCS